MSEEFIVAQAAPTLAGMKTGSLFGCPYRDKAALYADVRGWNRRLRMDGEFPHEIGLFLSYPPEDVRGFIENRAANYKLVGTWKVYGDVDKARETFKRYRDCTENYRTRQKAGSSIEQLAV